MKEQFSIVGIARMIDIGVIVSILVAIAGVDGLYEAPAPTQVHFPYRRVPTMTELIEDAGYRYDKYQAITEDGFILAMHRISPRGSSMGKRGIPVLLVNGFAFQAEGWLLLGNSSLPFILTDQGYDVWLGDQRGNIHSMKHIKYTIDDLEMFNYTFHEQGIYDLPAFIDKVRDVTGHDQILYVGYSLSSGFLIVMNSERPEYNQKLLGAVLLAPAGHLRKLENNPLTYSASIRLVDVAINAQIGARSWILFDNPDFFKSILINICPRFPIKYLCRLLIRFMYGESNSLDVESRFYQFATTLSTTSVFVGDHLFQVVERGRFARYDYKQESNKIFYGQSEPPNYYFEKTTIPVYLMYGGADNMVTPDAAERTGRDLKSVKKSKYLASFNHADFLMSTSAPRDIYAKVLEYFDSLSSNAVK